MLTASAPAGTAALVMIRMARPGGQVGDDLGQGHKGTGLGLPLSKSLVELHGGSLDLQSVPGAGTTVTLRFPAARIVEASRVSPVSKDSPFRKTV